MYNNSSYRAGESDQTNRGQDGLTPDPFLEVLQFQPYEWINNLELLSKTDKIPMNILHVCIATWNTYEFYFEIHDCDCQFKIKLKQLFISNIK